MAWGRAIRTLKCNTVYITQYRSMKIPVSFRTAYARADKNILVDSGTTDNFIDPRLIQRLRLGTHPLERARKIWNIDGTNNKAGMITNYVDLSIQTRQKQAKMRFLITDLGNEDLILGYPWLANFKPKFSWKEGVIDTSYLPIIVRSLDWETRLNQDTISRITSEPLSEQERVQIVENLEEECSLKSTISTKLAQDVMDPPVMLSHKVDPGLQDLQTRARRILAEKNAEKAEENTWIGRMVAAENINDMKALIKSRDST